MKTAIARLLITGVALAAPLSAMAGDLSLDLNKLESRNGSCRVTMVVVNGRPAAADALRADLVMFGQDGVVAKRLAVDLGPVPAGKTIVRAFDIAGLDCQGIGSILLNDLPACHFAGEAEGPPRCLDTLAVESKAGTRFFK
ncbi:hypothetical protein [Labrys monachus]|uniref:Tat pathway signal sequence domain protein n=1 Tax=Labrys monachus TaxID=217067 RepID=A0ABU0FAK4_9HYPH|nr:hypothetical protein [Labrys monachus]MDQ0391581.1 hypothetical protein [Labrys monachus]